MKSGRVKGGAAIPAVIGTGRQFRSNLAQPVFNASGKRVKGGSARKIIEITSDDLVQNGGQYKLMGGPAIPMQIVTDRAEKGGAAQVVYPVDILGNYDPTFAGYIYKLRQIESDNLVGLWAQNELAGGVSIDYSGHGYDGAYTAVTLGQPGVPGLGMSAAGYDGATSFNNIYSAGFANDNALLNPGFETPGAMPPTFLNWVDVVTDGAIDTEGVIVHEGADSCKITAGIGTATRIYQNFAVIPGQRRRFRIWSRGDGANAGRYRVYDSGAGTDIVPITSTGITAAAWGMVTVEYVVPPGCFTVGEFLYCPSVNGGIAYFDACEDRRMNGFLGDVGTLLIHAQVANVGVWTDLVLRRTCAFLSVTGTSFVIMEKTAGANRFDFRYNAGGVAKLVTLAPYTNLNYFVAGITWDISAGATGEVLAFVDGLQTGITQVGLGTWEGDLSNVATVLGARSTVPANVWSGNESIVSLWNTTLTPAQMADASVQ